uniref:Uncharacterized protein n=1 Tax=Branchiostoma floridae TaxID=7739 RepID=C3ZL25_BRAFL|eukprot:XP_002590696.1 hypothetical protein BRAFLDRAFT_89499 [Branchiostoma floridae]
MSQFPGNVAVSRKDVASCGESANPCFVPCRALRPPQHHVTPDALEMMKKSARLMPMQFGYPPLGVYGCQTAAPDEDGLNEICSEKPEPTMGGRCPSDVAPLTPPNFGEVAKLVSPSADCGPDPAGAPLPHAGPCLIPARRHSAKFPVSARWLPSGS